MTQQSFVFTPLKDDAEKLKAWNDSTDQQYRKLLSSLSKTYRKDYQSLYEDRYKQLKELAEKNKIITDAAADNYLQQLVNAIVSSNPVLKQSGYRVRFSRDYWPNAYCLGEGTIIFNIGLFTKLQNESQVASVLCHELAHQHLNHVQRSIDELVTTINSDDFRDELKRIKRSDYLQGQQLKTLMKGLTFTSRKHGRNHETSADSLALEWLKNTPFNAGGAISSLALLDNIDEDKYNVMPDLANVFNFPQYPFRKEWLHQEKTLFATMATSAQKENTKERDSLKTHPDCTKRIQLLWAKAQQYSKDNKPLSPVSEETFKRLQQQFDYEIIEYCYQQNEVSRSMYHTLQMLSKYPQDVYLTANTARCLNAFYKAQKEHALSKIVDLPSPFMDEKYEKTLQFIQNVRLNDFAAFSYYLLIAVESKTPHSELMLQALILSKQHFNKTSEQQHWMEQYKKQYPNGKFTFQ
ncbi:M48 family metalloprotease [Pseudoflavitalea sp. G-6-1-2]|nr:M48 family metalloprotease [Pseudoflavitalea sp. G-6-1-2]